MEGNDYCRRAEAHAALCYNSTVSNNLSENHHDLRGTGLKRFAVLVLSFIFVLALVYCGGGSSSSGTTTSKASHRAFVSNMYSGALQIMDTQNDTTPYTQQTTSSTGQVIPGSPIAIQVGTSASWEAVTSDRTKTMVFDPNSNIVYFVTN